MFKLRLWTIKTPSPLVFPNVTFLPLMLPVKTVLFKALPSSSVKPIKIYKSELRVLVTSSFITMDG